MKTAMEELLDELEKAYKKYKSLDMEENYTQLNQIIDYIKNNCIEQEKQQIKNAYIIGYSDCHSSSAKDQDLYFKLLYNGKDI